MSQVVPDPAHGFEHAGVGVAEGGRLDTLHVVNGFQDLQSTAVVIGLFSMPY